MVEHGERGNHAEGAEKTLKLCVFRANSANSAFKHTFWVVFISEKNDTNSN